MSAIDDFLEEVQELREARTLLEEIWGWYGPYGPDRHTYYVPSRVSQTTLKELQKQRAAMAMPEKLQLRLQNFFKFDDSE